MGIFEKIIAVFLGMSEEVRLWKSSFIFIYLFFVFFSNPNSLNTSTNPLLADLVLLTFDYMALNLRYLPPDV